jgi:DNA helicase-2/ATP-dependent DNA helicase PcrA
VRAFAAPTDLDEAAFVVDVVKGLADEGVPLSEVAMLYRSNAQSRVLEHAVQRRAALPRVGRHALLRARRGETRSPSCGSSRSRGRRGVPARRQFPPRGIGARTLEQLQDVARGRARACGRPLRAVLSEAGGQQPRGVHRTIETLRARLRRCRCPRRSST